MKKSEYIEKYGEAAYEEYKAKCREYQKENYSTEKAREKYYKYKGNKCSRSWGLYKAYKNYDESKGYETSVTPKYIKDVIFNGKCIYCGETDWRKLGCDRIDSTQGHTIGNVVCSCGKCNVERGSKDFDWYRENLRKYTPEEQAERIKISSKKHYENNKEKIMEYQKKHIASIPRDEYLKKRHEYYLKNKEKLIAWQKEYYEANKEKLNEYGKAYYEANKETIKEYQKQWREDHKNYMKLYRENRKIACE